MEKKLLSLDSCSVQSNEKVKLLMERSQIRKKRKKKDFFFVFCFLYKLIVVVGLVSLLVYGRIIYFFDGHERYWNLIERMNLLT